VLSWLGDYGGGLALIPFGWDLLLCTVLALGIFAWATRAGLDAEEFAARLAGLEDLATVTDTRSTPATPVS
jgi:hypothetical protein